MKEFLMLIRTREDHFTGMSPEHQKEHVQKAGAYIGGLLKSGQLKSAQPLEMEGAIITREGKLKDGPFNESKEVIAGYFLIEAKDMDEALSLARANPVLDDPTSRIEVRPIMKMEGIN